MSSGSKALSSMYSSSPSPTPGWGSRGTKRKGEYIKMYSASVRKYDMRLITRIGLWRLRLALKQHTYYLEP